MTAFDLRHKLMVAGYSPLPVHGKAPPMAAWQTKLETSDDEIRLWDQVFPRAQSTGILTRLTPTFDIDILNPEAAKAVEDLVRDRFEDAGYILVRIGQAPKRAIPFRTNDPFKKIAANLTARDGSEGQKLELLADGQQVVAFGDHEKTGKPYAWFGGEPGDIKHDDLPYIDADQARQLVEDAAALLCREHGYRRAAERPAKRHKANGAHDPAGAADWGYLAENIRAGRDYHVSLCALAAKFVASGMAAGAVVNFLYGLMDTSPAPHDARWQERRNEIPSLVQSAQAKRQEPADKPDFEPWTIDQTIAVFERWLTLSSLTPVYAVLGTIAANLLPGDPVWLGLIAPPSSAKTEILNSTLLLPHVVQAATVTPAGWLSGTPKKQRDKGARGGLLQQIGDFGIVVLKDFGSVISMRPDARAEAIAALREIYDGAWTRHLGTDGGKTLAWAGKVGLLFGATGVIDSHYAVIGAMGDRFLLCRLGPTGEGQFSCALRHVGAATGQMRRELADAVAHLFAGRRPEPRPITDDEVARIDRIITLVVRLRGAVERDRYSREIEAIYGAEGPARIGLALERLLAGLDTLGIERDTAMQVVVAVAMDSVPPLRRRAYEYLRDARSLIGQDEVETGDVAAALGLPTTTVRRTLEDLAAYGLVVRHGHGKGQSDTWVATPPAG